MTAAPRAVRREQDHGAHGDRDQQAHSNFSITHRPKRKAAPGDSSTDPAVTRAGRTRTVPGAYPTGTAPSAPQQPSPQSAPLHRSGPAVHLISHTSTAGWPPEALSTGK
jgi:hypothetical protein